MIIKALIKRQIKKGKDLEAFELIKKIRLNAMHQEGYISGETLINTNNPQEVLVISTWESMECWNNWMDNQDRTSIDVLLEEFQEAPTTFEAYAFSKHKAYVEAIAKVLDHSKYI